MHYMETFIPMNYVGVTQNPVLPGKSKRIGFPRVMVVSCLTEIRGDVQQSNRL